MHLSPGTLLQGGKYSIIRILGQGGFGITYLGEQVGLGRKVAIKEFFMRDYCNRDRGSSHISIGSTGSLEMVERFRQKFVKEAQIIATLKHHHIINIYDIFEENKTAYYVMEYIDSGSLSEKIGENGIKEQEALHYIRQVASALSYIHNKDMNHLDVKPGNILIDEDNNAILIDFGLAKHYDEKGKQTTTTPVGISHGYAPAEQYVMGGVSVFTPTTDIYSLGATLYKMLTGDTPPDANIVNEEGLPPLPMHITSATRYAVTQAMQPRRKDRPQSIADFLALLDGKEAAADDEKTNFGGDLGGGGGNNRGGSTAGEETNLGVGGNGNNGETQPGGGGNNGGTTPEPQPVPTPKPQPTPKRKRNLKWLWITLALVVVGIVGYFVEGGQGDSGTIEGYEWVDLGLPSGLKWATCNVGAYVPEGYGNYYAWGETSTKSEYTEENCQTYGKNLGDISGNAQYDAAAKNWGGSWRMPTRAEFEELIDHCDWQWTTQNGVRGYKVTSKTNSNSIFLPAAGWFRWSQNSAGVYGYYWSSTPYEAGTDSAWVSGFDNGDHGTDWFSRYHGYTVRPVSN